MATMNQRVYLTEANEQHLEALKGFSLEENQLQYTSMPIPAYEKCLIDRNRLPVVIMGNGRVVGFFVLDQGEDVASYSANPYAILLRAFSVNLSEQGMGYGRASIGQLKPIVRDRFTECNEIV
ncbi:MAG: GNAT family N-acetyltransferase, partial [Anaerobacillus sp.]